MALEQAGVATFPTPIAGRIPNFNGAEAAAKLLSQVLEFKEARVIKVSPDSPQKPVRTLALSSGKKLIVPTPRLAQGFRVLDPHDIPKHRYIFASTIGGSAQLGKAVEPASLPTVDLIVTGSVAVDSAGRRLGKGEGYSEIEYAVLAETGKIRNRTPIATTIHELQLVEKVPSEPFDFQVDIIATPGRVIRTPGKKTRPAGLIWDRLSEEKVSSIPILRQLKELRGMSGRTG